MEEFHPQNSLEEALKDTQAGLMPVKIFLGAMLASDIAIPSVAEVRADGTGLVPLIYEREGVSRVAVFTDKDRAGRVSNQASFLLVMKGFSFLKRVPAGFGLVINPGYPVGLEMTVEGVSNLKRDFLL
jgi:hypothetical protein